MFSAKNLILLAKRYQKNSQSGFPTFQIDVQMQSSIMHNVAKGFYISENGFYIFEKGFYIFEKGVRFFRGAPDSANNANKVAR